MNGVGGSTRQGEILRIQAGMQPFSSAPHGYPDLGKNLSGTRQFILPGRCKIPKLSSFLTTCSYQQGSRENMNRMTAKDNPVAFQGNMDQPAPGRALEPGKIRLFLLISPIGAKTTMG
jgi:hypothetical protein